MTVWNLAWETEYIYREKRTKEKKVWQQAGLEVNQEICFGFMEV